LEELADHRDHGHRDAEPDRPEDEQEDDEGGDRHRDQQNFHDVRSFIEFPIAKMNSIFAH
jgi:hypothetical protein